jgi:hypothetical protein
MMRGLKKIKKTKSRILVSPPHEEEKTQINKTHLFIKKRYE